MAPKHCRALDREYQWLRTIVELLVDILTILFPLALACAAAFVLAFRWAARSGQFDDLDTPALRVLTDDDALESPHE